MKNLRQLTTQAGACLDQNGVELDVEALQRAIHSRRATTDDDDVVMLFARHSGQRTVTGVGRGAQADGSRRSRPARSMRVTSNGGPRYRIRRSTPAVASSARAGDSRSNHLSWNSA